MKAFKIDRPETAFSNDPGRRLRKRPREQDAEHLRWVRTLPCLLTGRRDTVEAAHVRYPDPRYAKPETGMGVKPHDRWVVPLVRDLHREGPESQHDSNERAWWYARRVDPVAVAAALWSCTGDDESGELILKMARNEARLVGER